MDRANVRRDDAETEPEAAADDDGFTETNVFEGMVERQLGMGCVCVCVRVCVV